MKSFEKFVQFIDDEGNVFQTSKTLLASAMAGTIRGDFVVLTRMPLPVDMSRFPASPMYGAGKFEAYKDKNVDAYSQKFKKEQEQKKATEDKVIRW